MLSSSKGFIKNIYQHKPINIGLHFMCQKEAQNNQVKLNFIWMPLTWYINNMTIANVLSEVWSPRLLFQNNCLLQKQSHQPSSPRCILSCNIIHMESIFQIQLGLSKKGTMASSVYIIDFNTGRK